jgi:2-polyprenyl-3-methyl-5-hydroxy-6-metoxy-1,4-benzoquinol methylase
MSANLVDLGVVLYRKSRAVAPEWAWGQQLCEEFLRDGLGPCPLYVFEKLAQISLADVLARTHTALVGVVLDDVAFWDPAGWGTLCKILVDAPHIGAVAPVSNEAAVVEQRVSSPFLYQTPSLFRLACHQHRQALRGQWKEVKLLDPFAFLCRRTDLEKLDPQTSLAQVPACLSQRGLALALVLDTYVHRYARMYEQERSDLQTLVQRDVKHVLDIGCAAGAFGAALKARQPCRVVGIELNSALGRTAAQRLDQVLHASIEDLPETTFGVEFDCIICGDVLEHLRDPWATVAKLTSWLVPKGRIIATLPNVGHWSVAADLLQGRWDLVPFSLLCWGHLRFFTRPGIERLFAGNGLTIELLQGMTAPLPAVGETFLQQAASLVPSADLESLRTNEFLVIAQKVDR